MSLGLTDQQRLDNIRVSLKIAHDRNKELASYIRLTDVAIWGFVAFTFLELFTNLPLTSSQLFYKVPLFFLLLVISMTVWRYTVDRYQQDIIIGYRRIIYCETELQIPDELSLKMQIGDALRNNTYFDAQHKLWNTLAMGIIIFSTTFVIFWLWIFNYS